jgi:hypothetical protein
MDLATHQRVLLGLIRSSTLELGRDADAYFRRVAASDDLKEARGNIFLWRVYVLERTCVLSVGLLRQRGRLDAALDAFIRVTNISPFRELQPLAFLDFLSADLDALVASVAQFELALMKARAGDPGVRVVRWNREPRGILKALAENSPIDAGCRDGAYVTRISPDLPYLFDVQPLL